MTSSASIAAIAVAQLFRSRPAPVTAARNGPVSIVVAETQGRND